MQVKINVSRILQHDLSSNARHVCQSTSGVTTHKTCNTACAVFQVFCEEAGSDAGYFRQFVAATYSRFWARYAPRLGQRPHCYEVSQHQEVMLWRRPKHAALMLFGIPWGDFDDQSERGW